MTVHNATPLNIAERKKGVTGVLITSDNLLSFLPPIRLGTGGGTVTSVGLTVPSGFSVSGSPVTVSGTLAITGILAKTAGGTGTATPALVAGTGISITGAWPNQTIAVVNQPYDVSAFYPGAPTASAKIVYVPVAQIVNYVANFSTSFADAATAATASTVFTIKQNTTTIGTITFAASGTTGTFASSGGTTNTFAAGDIFSITAPASPDATLADIGFVVAGVR